MDELKQFMEQHINSYKNAIKDSINNNTYALFEEDIASLLKKPPLDSMDLIKNKLITLAKKNKIVLNTESLDKIVNEYRDNVILFFKEFEEYREKQLITIVDKYELKKEEDIIKINKKEFSNINKDLKKRLKEIIIDSYNKTIKKNIDSIYKDDVDAEIKNSINDELDKYMNKNYLKQIIEGVDFKLLVKDTTLINNIKEAGDRYLFTINNSRLLNNKE